ncbi:MAG: peptidylprolyl isomerase [Pedobacter sp.]|nr:peptidylprolyl isomerase [Chitinophagaceae bacterium]
MRYLSIVIGIIFSVGLNAQTKSVSTFQKKVLAKKSVQVISKKDILPKEQLVEITTSFGVMVAKLYNQTPLHRDNFIKLIKQGFYDSLLFHRVIKDFMIQGGDPTSKYAADTFKVGGGAAPGEKISAEIMPSIYHKKGALAAARDGNPAKASSTCQFYIVQGKKSDSAQLQAIYDKRVKAANPAFQFSPIQKEVYERIGGTPQLDQSYTVFGEVITGLDVVDKIAAVTTKPGDRPVENVRMKIRLLN